MAAIAGVPATLGGSTVRVSAADAPPGRRRQHRDRSPTDRCEVARPQRRQQLGGAQDGRGPVLAVEPHDRAGIELPGESQAQARGPDPGARRRDRGQDGRRGRRHDAERPDGRRSLQRCPSGSLAQRLIDTAMECPGGWEATLAGTSARSFVAAAGVRPPAGLSARTSGVTGDPSNLTT